MVTTDAIGKNTQKMSQANSGPAETPAETPPARAERPITRPYAAFRLPPFSADETELWLAQVECACRVSGIDDNEVKFNLLAANLPLEVAAQVRDVVTSQPPDYNALKEALKNRLTQSRAARLSELLRNQQLGDQRPTQLLLRMRTELSATGDVPQGSQLLRTLFLQRLPQSARAALSLLAEDTPLDQLAMAADRFMASSSPAVISALGTSAAPAAGPPATAAVGPADGGTIAALCTMVASLTASVNRLEARSRDREPDAGHARRAWRPRSRSRPARQQRERQQPQPDTLCFYHYRFGADAHNCEPPCSWPAGNDRA